MKFSVRLFVATCVIISSSAAFADVVLIAKNSTSDHAETSQNQDQHGYDQQINDLNAESDSIAAQLGNRKPASMTATGTTNGYSVVLMKKKHK